MARLYSARLKNSSEELLSSDSLVDLRKSIIILSWRRSFVISKWGLFYGEMYWKNGRWIFHDHGNRVRYDVRKNGTVTNAEYY